MDAWERAVGWTVKMEISIPTPLSMYLVRKMRTDGVVDVADITKSGYAISELLEHTTWRIRSRAARLVDDYFMCDEVSAQANTLLGGRTMVEAELLADRHEVDGTDAKRPTHDIFGDAWPYDIYSLLSEMPDMGYAPLVNALKTKRNGPYPECVEPTRKPHKTDTYDDGPCVGVKIFAQRPDMDTPGVKTIMWYELDKYVEELLADTGERK